MSFLNSMQNRYTTKVYDQSQKLNSKQIEELKKILNLSPSSINSQPWHFTFVSNSKIKNKLAEVSFHNKEKIINCDSVVVFERIDDISKFEEDISTRLPAPAFEYYKKHLLALSDEKKKAWIDKQLYLALGVFLSACAVMNIDSTPMEGIEPEKYDEILDLNDYKTSVAVAIGYRDAEDFNRLEVQTKVRRNIEKVVKSF